MANQKTILVLAADPQTKAIPLKLDHEVRQIDLCLRNGEIRDRFKLEQRWAVQPKDLRRALLDVDPYIVHFCGHGAGTPGLAFLNESDETQFISTEALSALFALFSDQIKCVLLNACHAAHQAEAICQHIDYVIGMRPKIYDPAAIAFATEFYKALGAGAALEAAYHQGCQGISAAGYGRYGFPELHRKNQAPIITQLPQPPVPQPVSHPSPKTMTTPFNPACPAGGAGQIYALLVGIDAYPPGVNPLQGCGNDINALETYLNEWVDPTGDSSLGSQSQRLVLQKLTNEYATHNNIIAGFRHHLRQATAEDVVLFAYSGHGSQEKAHPVFKHLEPDGLNETLLCYDSRQPGHWPLADKELNALLAEIGERCPHIVVILDCCHSGHGVRDIATVRRMAKDNRDRPLDSYLLPAETLAQLAAQSTAPSPSGWYLSGADHYVLLAACQDSQTAKEYPIDGKIRGAFSHFLLESLKQANGNLTYRDLFRRTKALVESNVKTQSPQLETPDQALLNQFFLSGGIQPHPPYFTLKHDTTKGWVIDGGAIHRIPPPQGEETTRLAIFPSTSAGKQLYKLDNSIAQADVTAVFPHQSHVTVTAGELVEGNVFKAMITHLPVSQRGVYLEGDQPGVEALRSGLTPIASTRASQYVGLVESLSEAKFRVLAQEGRYEIRFTSSDRPLTAPLNGYSLDTARQVVSHLEHITRWLDTVSLAPPTTSQIPPHAVQMQLFDEEGVEIQTPHFEYRQNAQGEWEETPFRLRLVNTGRRSYYCTVLTLSEQYGIETLFDAGVVRLAPGDEVWALGGGWLYPQVPRDRWAQDGVTETKDVFKLIVSTVDFDARILCQDELDPHRPEKDLSQRGLGGRTMRGSLHGLLNHLMNRIQWRTVSDRRENASLDDWTTSQLEISTIRPRNP